MNKPMLKSAIFAMLLTCVIMIPISAVVIQFVATKHCDDKWAAYMLEYAKQNKCEYIEFNGNEATCWYKTIGASTMSKPIPMV